MFLSCLGYCSFWSNMTIRGFTTVNVWIVNGGDRDGRYEHNVLSQYKRISPFIVWRVNDPHFQQQGDFVLQYWQQFLCNLVHSLPCWYTLSWCTRFVDWLNNGLHFCWVTERWEKSNETELSPTGVNSPTTSSFSTTELDWTFPGFPLL